MEVSVGTRAIKGTSSRSSLDKQMIMEIESLPTADVRSSGMSSKRGSLLSLDSDGVNQLSFQAVSPVSISIHDLSLEIDANSRGIGSFATLFKGKKEGSLEEPQSKPILKNIS